MEATGLDSQVNDYAYLSTASLWMQFVVSDGTFAYAKADFNGVQRSADEVHAMALANLDGEYATVIRAGDALDAS